MMVKANKQPIILVVLDGWGIAPSWGGNAISLARLPVYDKLKSKYPFAPIQASGESVGLPTNSPGNSEAGHLNLGAGQIVRQDVTLIDNFIENGSFFSNEGVIESINHAKKNNSNLHLLGLLSKTGTHSHIRHLYALLEVLKQQNFKRVFIHLFSDGRDSDPMDGIEVVDEVEKRIEEIGIGQIASISGRYYAMDRDNRWGRIARVYNLLVKGEGNCFETAKQAFAKSYSQGITDEFIEPRLIVNKTQPKTIISSGDSVIVFNFRSDRVREITLAFLSDEVPQFPDRQKLSDLHFSTFVIYDDHLPSKQVFKPERVSTPLAKIWSDQGKTQFHIAETEKYPHVTYFFNGGTEQPFPGEDRLLVPSPRNVKTYDYVPRMNAQIVTDSVIEKLKKETYDFMIINFANPDMVGHTGNLGATIQAVEFVDKCLGTIIAETFSHNGAVFITGDHGNAEQMVNPQTGEPDTEHTTNPVPFVIVSEKPDFKSVKLGSNGTLSSIAPTMLDLAGIPQPETMRSKSLRIKENIGHAINYPSSN